MGGNVDTQVFESGLCIATLATQEDSIGIHLQDIRPLGLLRHGGEGVNFQLVLVGIQINYAPYIFALRLHSHKPADVIRLIDLEWGQGRRRLSFPTRFLELCPALSVPRVVNQEAMGGGGKLEHQKE